ncbi:enoyl-CoA hydratase/isomerase family protein [Nocardia yunnanensis]|uniref:Enoyl-CoA hydratase/isomerase family protein n=1 Tax=Nocardia yunnanensis TaxID=2382165 RepID=A0A386ZPR9_9NOCA|nr:enoyl-CoA hydratase/isomerase family protein [Nocardia yunnanensis]AYF79567.1 enoyl-CoA hydratase/isomerase family protein [Nocardia yunnanensis]
MFVAYLGERGEGEGENRFHPDWVRGMEDLLDRVEGSSGARGLVTVGAGKFYSTGFDVEWAAAHPERINENVGRLLGLFARIVTLPMPTVAAINGHAYGAGAFLAVAHDYRVMRGDRGYVCFPGVTLGVNYAPGMVELAQAQLPLPLARRALVTGHRYGGAEALAAGLVDSVAGEDDVLRSAVEYAQSLAHTAGPALGHVKSTLYRTATAALLGSVAEYNHDSSASQ